MTAGAPVIVNAVCGATREHCEQSGAGMWFEGYAEFEAVLDRMLGDLSCTRPCARTACAMWRPRTGGRRSWGAMAPSWMLS